MGKLDHPVLVAFGGLPGVGKTAIARELASQLDAVYIRIDSIEQALRDARGAGDQVHDSGYRVGYAITADNLRLGRIVVADSVNPLRVTRDAWISVAHQTHAKTVEVEIVCSDPAEHRRRVTSRTGDIPGLRCPTWHEVVSRDYEKWDREHTVIDTARLSVKEAVEALKKVVAHT